MSFWNRVVCLFKGHETSLYPGIGAPAAFSWSHPGSAPPPAAVSVPAPTTVPVQPNTFLGVSGVSGISGSSRGGIGVYAVGGAGAGVVAHTGPAYNLDLCPRCFTIYASPPPPICKHCGTEKDLHKEDCGLPCQNCGKSREAHTDGKCLFEASNYKGFTYAPA